MGSLSLSLRPIFATTCVFQSPGLMGMSASWPGKVETPMRKRDAVQRVRWREGLRGFIGMLLEWIVTGAREESSTWVWLRGGAEETRAATRMLTHTMKPHE